MFLFSCLNSVGSRGGSPKGSLCKSSTYCYVMIAQHVPVISRSRSVCLISPVRTVLLGSVFPSCTIKVAFSAAPVEAETKT